MAAPHPRNSNKYIYIDVCVGEAGKRAETREELRHRGMERYIIIVMFKAISIFQNDLL